MQRAVSLALVALLVWVSACTSWQQVEIGELPAQDKVRVVSVSTGSTVITDARVERDSIKGMAGNLYYAIPLAGVSSVEAELSDSADTRRKLAWGVAAGALVAGFIVVMTNCVDSGFLGPEWTC